MQVLNVNNNIYANTCVLIRAPKLLVPFIIVQTVSYVEDDFKGLSETKIITVLNTVSKTRRD